MNNQTILMKDLAGTDFIYGAAAGAMVLEKLRALNMPDGTVLEVDFTDMRVIDPCFIRDGLASFLKIHCGSIGLFVTNVPNVDIVENAALGFKAKGLPMLMKSADGSGTVVAELTSSVKELIRITYGKKEMTTHQLAKELNVSAPNASAKLKKMFIQGLLLATKSTAESGGLEYLYRPFFITGEVRFANA